MAPYKAGFRPFKASPIALLTTQNRRGTQGCAVAYTSHWTSHRRFLEYRLVYTPGIGQTDERGDVMSPLP